MAVVPFLKGEKASFFLIYVCLNIYILLPGKITDTTRRGHPPLMIY